LYRVEEKMVENVRELLKAHGGLTHEVYLDLENSSPTPAEIVESMLPYFNKRAYGNPTLTHKLGWEAFEVIMESAQKMSSFLGSESVDEINFTPGETEANNLAMLGTVSADKKKQKNIVISEIEPISIIETANLLKKTGVTTTRVPVDREGFIDLEKLGESVKKETVLVSVSHVNHEIGTVQPIKEAVEIVKDKNCEALFHTDASDAFARIPFSVDKLKVDLATISSYKIQGPRGAGALYVREGVNIERILEGQLGTQKLWPGIENTPAIVGFIKASELGFANFRRNMDGVRRMRDFLIDGILRGIPDVKLNGPSGKRVPDNVNISFLRCEGEALTIELSLKGVYVSSGSACSRRLLRPSHVLVAIGRQFDEAHGSILMKVTRYHTEEDIRYVLDVIPKAVERLRGITGSTGVD
jgi:cysteine desulfurase